MHFKTIALFAKRGKPGVAEASLHLQKAFPQAQIYEGAVGEPFPQMHTPGPDLVISYLSPWIIPKSILDSAQLAINFHPGPPAYPGVGCFNFALYDGASEYGITCHHMAEKVDTGAILAVSRFPVLADETPLSLSLKSYTHILKLFVEMLDQIQLGAIPSSTEKWLRHPYTRKDLEDLCRLTSDMQQAEALRRIAATTYPNAPGAYIDFFGRRFSYDPAR